MLFPKFQKIWSLYLNLHTFACLQHDSTHRLIIHMIGTLYTLYMLIDRVGVHAKQGASDQKSENECTLQNRNIMKNYKHTKALLHGVYSIAQHYYGLELALLNGHHIIINLKNDVFPVKHVHQKRTKLQVKAFMLITLQPKTLKMTKSTATHLFYGK